MQSKKYKLVKLYPNSPKLDTIHSHPGGGDWLGTYIYDFNNNEFWQEIKEVKLEVPIGTKFKTKLSDTIYIIKEALDNTVDIYEYPDKSGEHGNWIISEVNENFKSSTWIIYKEKSFEILEFKYSDRIDTLRENGKYGIIINPYGSTNKEGVYDIESYLTAMQSSNAWKITSIKRLSDGVIFSVGDRVNWNWTKCSRAYFTIKRFRVDKNEVLRFDVVEQPAGDNFNFIHCILNHYNHFLFTDDLGNEIFEGDEYYFTWLSNIDKKYSISRIDYADITSGKLDRKYNFYFKFKEDIIRFIKSKENENAPIYSKKQIRDAVDYSSAISTTIGVFFDEFKFMQKLGL